jgi:hypothetical protein
MVWRCVKLVEVVTEFAISFEKPSLDFIRYIVREESENGLDFILKATEDSMCS